MGYIYLLVDTRNGKKYVGKHNGEKPEYWASGLLVNKIAKKYGKNIFDRTILEDNVSNELLNEKEKFYIKEHNSFVEGYNLSLGGDGGGHWILTKSKEEIDRISKIKSEKLKNRVFSDETIQKMKESGKKKKLTQQHKNNISKAVKLRGGFPHTQKTKDKLSEFRKGTKNPGHSKFMKDNNPNCRKILINNVEYKSIVEASNILGIPYTTIKFRLNNKNNTNYIKLN
jgi:hypothetical protein